MSARAGEQRSIPMTGIGWETEAVALPGTTKVRTAAVRGPRRIRRSAACLPIQGQRPCRADPRCTRPGSAACLRRRAGAPPLRRSRARLSRSARDWRRPRPGVSAPLRTCETRQGQGKVRVRTPLMGQRQGTILKKYNVRQPGSLQPHVYATVLGRWPPARAELHGRAGKASAAPVRGRPAARQDA